jgi:hypothetical protein
VSSSRVSARRAALWCDRADGADADPDEFTTVARIRPRSVPGSGSRSEHLKEDMDRLSHRGHHTSIHVVESHEHKIISAMLRAVKRGYHLVKRKRPLVREMYFDPPALLFVSALFLAGTGTGIAWMTAHVLQTQGPRGLWLDAVLGPAVYVVILLVVRPDVARIDWALIGSCAAPIVHQAIVRFIRS